MKKILFVDDEVHILDGLRDLLRKERKQWDMVFALGGEAALAELERGNFDVVVTDMRMPGVDGVAVLQQVKERHPATARIILSGHAEREAVIDALPVAHQFLSKPCDAELLRSVVDRACSLLAILQDDNLRTVIGNVDRLPSTPHTYWALNQAAARPDVMLGELAAIIEKDPAMALKTLQLVNSSYFGLAHKQASVQHALAQLGVDLVRSLSLTAHAFGACAVPAVDGFSLDTLQQDSLVVARLAKVFTHDAQHASEAFTAGIVHDIGKVVLALSVPVPFADVLRICRATGRPDHVVEQEVLGFTHAEVGAYLLGLWGLPLGIVEAVACHHQPARATANDTLAALQAALQMEREA